ncbi:MAG: hypothetical protein LBS76_02495 [Mycoplasmataceae bacterium]|nr:hypothetical protein [Mycoplasmataceae bacterium]
MKETKVEIIKSTQKNRVGVEETFRQLANSGGRGGSGVKKSKRPTTSKPKGAPEWFKAWSETVYQNQQPAWFKAWSETQFEPLKQTIEYNVQSGVLKKPK